MKSPVPPTKKRSQPNRVAYPAPLEISEVVVGKKIQSLRDCDVFEVKAVEGNHRGEYDMQSRIARKSLFQESKDAKSFDRRYAIRFIKEKCMSSHNIFESAASRLAKEGDLMIAFNHPNIMRVHGIARDHAEAYYVTGRHDAFFLLYDRIHETLHDRIRKWKVRQDRLEMQSHIPGLKQAVERKSLELLVQRLRVAYDIAGAIEYLHEQRATLHGLISSDIFGFDHEDTVKLFDFGFVHKNSKADFDDEETTSIGLIMETRSDVLAFSMMLGEMLTFQTLQNTSNVHNLISVTGIPNRLVNALWNGISADPYQRPSMRMIRHSLQDAIVQFCGKELEEANMHSLLRGTSLKFNSPVQTKIRRRFSSRSPIPKTESPSTTGSSELDIKLQASQIPAVPILF